MMMENGGSSSSGFSTNRSDNFPAGLRVLVVDDDLTWLKILEKMLKKCLYEVTTCCLASEALSKLRERKDGFDIVISDVNMPDMDGFKLVEHVGLEMDLPVIMMSVDGETSRVMKGVQHGACDYLLKPIRMKELRNIWQHVLRKRIHEVNKDVDCLESFEAIQMMRIGFEQSGEEYFPYASCDTGAAKKRKDIEPKHDDRELGDPSAKRARVAWTVDLHQKFVKAVDQIGLEKIGPKKILDSMNVPWLTRENVASHLQKYRLYLSRLKDESHKSSEVSNHRDLEFCGGNLCDTPSGVQGPISNQSTDASGSRIFDKNGSESRPKSFLILELKMEQKTVTSVSNQMKNTWMGVIHSFESVESGANHTDIDSNNSTRNIWNTEMADAQYGHLSTQNQSIDDELNYQPMPKPSLPVNFRLDLGRESTSAFVEKPPQVSLLTPSPSEISTSVEITLPYTDPRSNYYIHRNRKAPVGTTQEDGFDKFPLSNVHGSFLEPSQPDNGISNNRIFEMSSSVKIKLPHAESSGSNQNNNKAPVETITDSQSLKHATGSSFNTTSLVENHTFGCQYGDSELALIAFGKDFQAQWHNGDPSSSGFQLDNNSLLDYYNECEPDITTNVPSHLYDALRFDYCWESPGSPPRDHSISIITDPSYFRSSSYPVS